MSIWKRKDWYSQDFISWLMKIYLCFWLKRKNLEQFNLTWINALKVSIE